ncbi:MmyB family transcriptional regulator [Hamadaea tsunoensis]|uniref:MmyB family transcriptional regulator n=1 Tax=Hamadaea tsunoensis TaxID=53368 RepID=UPI00146FC39D|nr:helix-turn-helix domain-containing protein [Hamadaea tsunoensis]
MAVARSEGARRRKAVARPRRAILASNPGPDRELLCQVGSISDYDLSWLNTRSDLSALLRSWRMRRTPHDFPDFPELSQRPRRSGYLTVEDAAAVCGVSPAWYRSFETGEPNGYSVAFLERVAAMLDLDIAERETMFLLATGHAPTQLSVGGIQHLSPGARVILDTHAWPAYILDHAGAILARNHSSLAWFPSQRTANHLFVWLFTNPGARTQFLDWSHVARNSLAHLRIQYARAPHCQLLQETLKTILESSSEARVMWKVNPRVSFGEDRHVRRVLLPDAPAETEVEIVSATLDGRLGLRLHTFVPVGGYRPTSTPTPPSRPRR